MDQKPIQAKCGNMKDGMKKPVQDTDVQSTLKVYSPQLIASSHSSPSNEDASSITSQDVHGDSSPGKSEASSLPTAVQCSSKTPDEHYSSQCRSSLPELGPMTVGDPVGSGTIQYSQIHSSNIFVASSVSMSSPESAVSIGPGFVTAPKYQTATCKPISNVAKFSTRFGSIIKRIEETISKEMPVGEFLSIACELTSTNPKENIFPTAFEADDLRSFFKLGKKYEWWNWMDFDRLITLLSECNCCASLEILQHYQDELAKHVSDTLDKADAHPPTSKGEWLQMKCHCDSMNVTLETIKEHKLFLTKFLRVPEEAFTVCGYYEGCTVTVYRIHSEVRGAEIKAMLQSLEGAIRTDLSEVSSVVVPVDVGDLCFKLTCPPTHQPGCMVGGTVVTLPPSVVVKACGDTEQIRANMGTEIPSCSAEIGGTEELEVVTITPPPDLEPLELSFSEEDKEEDIEHYCKLAERGELDVDHLPSKLLSAVNNEGDSLLMIAVKHNHPTIVEALLKCNLSQDVRDMQNREEKRSAVTIAAQCDHCECLQVLLRYDCHPAIPDVTEKLPLYYACANSCMECVKAITEPCKGLKGLYWVQSFVQGAGVVSELETIISECITRRQQEVVLPVLFKCAASGNVDAISEVLEEGDDVNILEENGETPLFRAAKCGKLEVMKALEKQGAKVELMDFHGNTLLHAAVQGGSCPVVKYTLQKLRGCRRWNVNAVNCYMETAMELAVLRGHSDIVQLLVIHGASLCVPDSSGYLLSCDSVEGTRLIVDKERGIHLDKLLKAIRLREDAALREFHMTWQDPYDHNLRTTDGDSVLMVATKSGRQRVISFLLESLQKCSRNSLVNFFMDQKSLMQPEVERVQSSLKPSRQCSLDSGIGSPRVSSRNTSCESSHLQHSHINQKVSSQAVIHQDLVQLVCVNHISGSTILHRAVESREQKIVTLTMKKCKNLTDVQDNLGNSPLHLAALSGNKGLIKLLVTQGADVCAQNLDGHLPEDMLPKKKPKAMYQLLLAKRIESTSNWNVEERSPCREECLSSSSSDSSDDRRLCKTGRVNFAERLCVAPKKKRHTAI